MPHVIIVGGGITGLATALMLTPLAEVLARPGMADRINEVAADSDPLPVPGPSRAEMLALLS